MEEEWEEEINKMKETVKSYKKIVKAYAEELVKVAGVWKRKMEAKEIQWEREREERIRDTKRIMDRLEKLKETINKEKKKSEEKEKQGKEPEESRHLEETVVYEKEKVREEKEELPKKEVKTYRFEEIDRERTLIVKRGKKGEGVKIKEWMEETVGVEVQ